MEKLGEKPDNVVLAIKFLWGTVALQIAKVVTVGLTQGDKHYDAASLLSVTLLALLSTIIPIFIIMKITAGKNWARLVFLLIFFLSMSRVSTILKSIDQPDSLYALICLAQYSLEFVAAFLLLSKPANQWFGAFKTA